MTTGIGRIMHITQDIRSHQEGGGPSIFDGKGHDAATPYQHIGLLGGTPIPIINPFNPNFLNPHRPDDEFAFPGDFELSKDDTRALFRGYHYFLKSPPCCCGK